MELQELESLGVSVVGYKTINKVLIKKQPFANSDKNKTLQTAKQRGIIEMQKGAKAGKNGTLIALNFYYVQLDII